MLPRTRRNGRNYSCLCAIGGRCIRTARHIGARPGGHGKNAKFFAISPTEGAQTIIYLASSPEVANVTGKYFYKCRPTTPSVPALDDRAALALWERSAA